MIELGSWYFQGKYFTDRIILLTSWEHVWSDKAQTLTSEPLQADSDVLESGLHAATSSCSCLLMLVFIVSPYYRTKLRGLYTTAKADAEAECKWVMPTGLLLLCSLTSGAGPHIPEATAPAAFCLWRGSSYSASPIAWTFPSSSFFIHSSPVSYCLVDDSKAVLCPCIPFPSHMTW